jgi:lysozyme family protein
VVVTFDTAFDRLISHEGGFTDKPEDDGNWTGGRQGRGELRGTKYGISAAAYPSLDIRNLTLDAAKELYRRDYWQRIAGLSPAMRFQWFDAAVNSGHGNAVRILQRAIGVADDGHWGPVSSARLAQLEPADVLMRFLAERLLFMTRLRRWDEFGRGWARRIGENLLLAAADD